MQIIVQAEKTITLEVENSETISHVKSKIHQREGIPAHEQYLYHGGKQLEFDLTLNDYNIKNGSTIALLTGLKGGGCGVINLPLPSCSC